MITLLDYGAGNVRSVTNALEKLGATVKTVTSGEDIDRAKQLVFPGVGNFGAMMNILHDRQLVEPLMRYLRANRPFFGICVALQALFEESDEAPGIAGLSLIKGRVKKFPPGLAVPHIGWNGYKTQQPSRIFSGLDGSEKLYFVHSYFVQCEEQEVILTSTDYGCEFTSSIQKGNIIATQFHPEKSGEVGLRILENFLESGKEYYTIQANKEPVSQAENIITTPQHCPKTTTLAKRIIACLDVRTNEQGDLVVTKGDQYNVREEGAIRNLGKPVQLAEEYYQQGADEIAFLNITGFRDFPLEDMPMIEVLQKTSKNVFVPLTIGGGIRDFTDCNGRHYTALEVAAEYFRSGADKISIGSDAVLIVENVLKTGKITGTSSIEQIAKVYGNQAVVISIDPRRVFVSSPDKIQQQVIKTKIPGPKGEEYCWYQCTIKGGREGRNLDAITLAKICEQLGAGEILLNCIDRDGTNSGFDIELINAVRNSVSIPVIASSGAGSSEHFLEVFNKTKAEAALAAGIFHRREIPIGEVKKFLAGKIETRNSDWKR
jgi:glutamine amidotransferase/cyclase